MKTGELIKKEIERLKKEKPEGWEDLVKDYETALTKDDEFIANLRKNIKDEVSREVEGYKTQLTELNDKLKKVKDKDLDSGDNEKIIATLKDSIKELETKLEETTKKVTAYESKIGEYETKETERKQKIKDRLEKVVEQVPEENRKRIPDFGDDAEKTLNYIRDNQDILGISARQTLDTPPGGTKTKAGEEQKEVKQPWDNANNERHNRLKGAIEDGSLDAILDDGAI